MTDPAAPTAPRLAPDGSPYPDRARPTFEREVRAMFTHIAHQYDWFNHVATLGQDLVWRPRALWAVDRFRVGRPLRWALDVGCGTGDLALLTTRHAPASRAVGIDFTGAMVVRATARARRLGASSKVQFGRATGLALPFRSGSFDLVMSAFVARNLSDLPKALREFRRVLVPGGTLLTLETTEPPSAVVRSMFHAYFDHVVPWLGAAVKSAGPFRYLPESLRRLPSRERMLELMRDAGFPRVDGVRQSQGIVTSFLGEAGAAAPASMD
ncbi:MAG TPA: ubiquinone/menaquinone biosynthesis methyltransferase [Thermoplasmata archaeon]|nr:ubiquinone/menaquinone biosynthesis methyltransferase [Thermoplasmata archaeon]